MHTASAVPFAQASHCILALRPRVAAFDCDGTLWPIDAGLGFLEWELERDLLDAATASTARTRLRAYQAGDLDEDTFNGYLASLHAGLTVATIEAAAGEYVATHIPPVVFRQMAGLLDELARSGCQIWLVSSTNQWVIEAAAPLVGVSPQHVLASAAVIVDGRATDRLIRVPNATGKRLALQAALGRAPDVAFGNSRWDAEMLAFAGHACAVHPTAELTEIAARHQWPVLLPT
jgi:phosphoserine phosphatase